MDMQMVTDLIANVSLLLKYPALTLVGLVWHGAMKWDEFRRVNAKADGVDTGLWEFLKTYRSQNLVSLMATIAAYVSMMEMEMLNGATAVAVGYMGNSVAENAMSRFSSKKE